MKNYKERMVEDDFLVQYYKDNQNDIEGYEDDYHKYTHKNLLNNMSYYLARADIAKLRYFKDIDDETVLEFGCFTSDNKILLDDFTEKKISDITENDRIICHNGNNKKILKTFVRETKEIIKFDIRGNESIKTTIEHPFFAIKKNDFICCNNILLRFGQKCKFCNKKIKPKPKFIQAEDLDVGDYVINPIPKLSNKLKYLNVNKYLKNYKIRKCKTSLPNKIKITNDLMWLFGIWLAEGSYKKAHKKINGIIFSLNINRKDLVKKINSILKIYGKTTTNVRENKNITEIYLCNKKLSILFYELFNEHSKNKRIHKDLFQTNAKKLLELFKGFYEGDGNSVKTKNNCYIRLTTISEKLRNQLYWIAIINKLPINKNKNYRLILNGDCKKINGMEANHGENESFKHTHSFYYDKWILRPIFKKIIKKEKNKVYNLNVEKPNTYLINNIAVHNCGLGQNIALLKNSWGYDVSKFALTKAKENGIKVISNLKDCKDFDIVFSRHVLEHCEEPMRELRKMRDCLRENGKLILVLPVEHQWKVPLKLSDNQHLYCWNFQTINNLLVKTGFTPTVNKFTRGTGYNKLLFLHKISTNLYSLATHLASYYADSKELVVEAIKE